MTIRAGGLGFDSWAGQNWTQCRQRLAIAAAFLRIRTAQALSREAGPPTRLTLRRNIQLSLSAMQTNKSFVLPCLHS